MSIKAIDKTSVHRICAGQVISDLPGCVKELVENALDAHATAIEVRFSTTGEASNNNGGGINEHNYASLCLKHYTSKISSFGDLSSVSTFGFRGEALSSLCAVAGGLSVVTRTDEDKGGDVAVKLDYDSNGKLVKTEAAAREKGTTVTIKNLFVNLPVRLREFKKNFRRELNKCIELIQAFALVSIDVRIMAIGLNPKSGRSILVSSCGNSSMKLNISNVFGSKVVPTVLEVDFSVSTTATLPEQASKKGSDDVYSQNDGSVGTPAEDVEDQVLDDEDTQSNARTINVKGLISRPIQNFGRTSNDRQFFYINNRPCDLPKLAKVVNEVYKTYNAHQYPVIVWNLIMDPDMFDVNVSPNKRTLFLHNERVVFENMKNQLEILFSPNRAFAVSNFSQPSLSSGVPAIDQDAGSSNPKEICNQKRTASQFQKMTADELTENDPESVKRVRVLESEQTSPNTDLVTPSVTPKLNFSGSLPPALGNSESAVPRARVVELMNMSRNDSEPSSAEKTSTVISRTHQTPGLSAKKPLQLNQVFSAPPIINSQRYVESINQHSKTLNCQTSEIQSLYRKRFATRLKNKALVSSHSDLVDVSTVVDEDAELDHKCSFHSGIQRDKESLAIEEFNRYISKTDFLEMRVLGQFNLGFIVVELRGDLFIVDQHASDEKFNYEDLMTSWKFTTQRLISPMPLDLPAQTELLAIEHADILKKNGFEIMVDETRMTGSRVHLVSIPQSTTTFGVADLEDLLHKINDCSTTSALEKVKCSRVLAQLASKACRKSIMIGDALDMNTMEKVVRHLSGLEHPWNCPHGRPTMRHLLNMKTGRFVR
ncbi:hypothetical protein BDR26DRAFT_797800 [Obelidium mucronatum]|nr:hypothetical protein BDR26DRAFT_797800 [Obelidium mucronatum]